MSWLQRLRIDKFLLVLIFGGDRRLAVPLRRHLENLL